MTCCWRACSSAAFIAAASARVKKCSPPLALIEITAACRATLSWTTLVSGGGEVRGAGCGVGGAPGRRRGWRRARSRAPSRCPRFPRRQRGRASGTAAMVFTTCSLAGGRPNLASNVARSLRMSVPGRAGSGPVRAWPRSRRGRRCPGAAAARRRRPPGMPAGCSTVPASPRVARSSAARPRRPRPCRRGGGGARTRRSGRPPGARASHGHRRGCRRGGGGRRAAVGGIWPGARCFSIGVDGPPPVAAREVGGSGGAAADSPQSGGAAADQPDRCGDEQR